MQLALDTLPMLWPILTVAGSAISAGTAVKYTARNNRERLKELSSAFVEHVADDLKHHTDAIDRLARIETKLDIVCSKVVKS